MAQTPFRSNNEFGRALEACDDIIGHNGIKNVIGLAAVGRKKCGNKLWKGHMRNAAMITVQANMAIFSAVSRALFAAL